MNRAAIFTGLLSGLLFGIATPFSKLLLADLNAFQLAGLLYLGAGFAMIPSLLKRGTEIRSLFLKDSILKTSGIILFGGIMGPLFYMLGLKTANAASVSIWLNLELVATAILGVLLFKDKLDPYTWLGVFLTVMAGIVTSMGEGISGLFSALLIMAACVCWGIDNHLTAITDGATPQAVTFIKGCVAGIVNVWIGISVTGFSFGWDFAFMAIIVGGFSYGMSIVLYVYSAQNMGATRAQIMFSTAPVWGILLSYLLFQDTFLWMHMISIILLILAVGLINIVTHKHQHHHQELEHVHYHNHNDLHHDHMHEEIIVKKGHSHFHKHDAVIHLHPHFPDLHHRHTHNMNEKV